MLFAFLFFLKKAIKTKSRDEWFRTDLFKEDWIDHMQLSTAYNEFAMATFPLKTMNCFTNGT